MDKEGEIVVIEEGDPKWFEIVEYKGEQAKHYPYTGAYLSVKTGKILGNEGGRKDFDADAMSLLGRTKKREAIIDGLTKAAIEQGVGHVPTAMLSEIVRKRAEIAATNDGRAGNDAAKLILGLVDFIEDDAGEQGPALRLDMDKETAKNFIRAMIQRTEEEGEAE